MPPKLIDEPPRYSSKTNGRQPLSVRAGVLALVLSTMWAGNPVANKAGLQDAGPLRLGWLRFVLRCNCCFGLCSCYSSVV
ncbi:MAG: hypothetical protein Ct9H300mP19_00640 [Dehalococcoidia bacterium]|nr:MAG: hypothetical protein Ct9H300mP19_00640 [Dehalococcoidia bacterium]